MNRRWNPVMERWEVAVDTPIGLQWQAETAPRPAVSNAPSASYNPQGRTRQPFYQQPTSEEEDLIGPEFGSVLGDALKGNQRMVGGGGGHGGGSRPYDIASMTEGMSKYPSLYLRKKRYS